jgi:hypothetical protein
MVFLRIVALWRNPDGIEKDRSPYRKVAFLAHRGTCRGCLPRTFPYHANHICCIFAGKTQGPPPPSKKGESFHETA